MKNTIRFILRYATYSYLLWSIFIACREFYSPRYTDCGIIESKSTDEVYMKYGSKTELYLNVRFKDTGFLSVKCNPTTYFSYQNGDHICFNLENNLTKFEHFTQIVGTLTLCLIAILCIMKFVIYIY